MLPYGLDPAAVAAVGEFMEELTKLSNRTGVWLTTMPCYVEVAVGEVGELRTAGQLQSSLSDHNYWLSPVS